MPSLKRNIAYQSAYQLLLIAAPLVTSPYVSRVLGPEGVGSYSWTYSIAQYFVLIAMLGIANHGARSVARVRGSGESNQSISDLLGVHLLASLVALLAYAGIVLQMPRGLRALAAVQALWIVGAMLDLNWLYSGLEEFGLIITRNAAVKIVGIAAIFIFVRTPDDLVVYALVLSASSVAGHLSAWTFIRRFVKLRTPRRVGMIAHLRSLAVMFIPVVAISVYKVAVRVVLGIVGDEAQVGFFASAERIVGIPLGLIVAFSSVMLPRMSRLISTGATDASLRLTRASFRYVCAVAFGLCFGISGIAIEFAPVFFGEGFAEVGPLIVGMSVSIPFIAFASVLRTQCLIPRSLDREYTFSLIVGAVVGLLSISLLIPRFLAVGAVVSLVLSEIAVCVVQAVVARRWIPVGAYARYGVMFAGAGLVMFLAVRGVVAVIGPGVSTIVVQVLVGSVLYSVLAGALLWFTRDDLFRGAVSSILGRLRPSR